MNSWTIRIADRKNLPYKAARDKHHTFQHEYKESDEVIKRKEWRC